MNDFGSLSINISDEDQLYRFSQVYHLNGSYTFKYGSGKDTLNVNEVITSAYAKETELREKGFLHKQKGEAEGLYVSNKGRSNKKDNRLTRNRSTSRGKSFQKSSINNKNDKGCFICGKDGHWKRECPDRGKNRNASSANITSVKKEPLILTVSVQDTRGECEEP